MIDSGLSVRLPGAMPGAEGVLPKKDDPAKVKDAAKQFEALLVGQILRSVRESSGGWLGSGGDTASDCATELAEQQFARVLAEQGGLGLAAMISAGLEKQSGEKP